MGVLFEYTTLLISILRIKQFPTCSRTYSAYYFFCVKFQSYNVIIFRIIFNFSFMFQVPHPYFLYVCILSCYLFIICYFVLDLTVIKISQCCMLFVLFKPTNSVTKTNQLSDLSDIVKNDHYRSCYEFINESLYTYPIFDLIKMRK